MCRSEFDNRNWQVNHLSGGFAEYVMNSAHRLMRRIRGIYSTPCISIRRGSSRKRVVRPPRIHVTKPTERQRIRRNLSSPQRLPVRSATKLADGEGRTKPPGGSATFEI
jgi:hypothetical protein